MKFQARVKELDLFVRFVSSIERVGPECVLQFTPAKLHAVILNDGTDDVAVWGAMSVATLFDSYRIQSLSNNEIALRMFVGNLVRALKTGGNDEERVDRTVVLKLLKKNGSPFLHLSIDVQGRYMIFQDIPVTPLTTAQTRQYAEPALPPPQVEVCLPALKYLRTIVEKMKGMGDVVTVRAADLGELSLRVESDGIRVVAELQDLPIPVVQGRRRPPGAVGQARVSVRKLLKVLHSYPIMPKTVVCSIVEDYAVVINDVVDDLYITFFVPIVAEPDG